MGMFDVHCMSLLLYFLAQVKHQFFGYLINNITAKISFVIIHIQPIGFVRYE